MRWSLICKDAWDAVTAVSLAGAKTTYRMVFIGATKSLKQSVHFQMSDIITSPPFATTVQTLLAFEGARPKPCTN